MMKETNSRSARAGARATDSAALGPVGQGGMTVEEEIMLTGQAATPAIAAEMAAGFVGHRGAVREARTAACSTRRRIPINREATTRR